MAAENTRKTAVAPGTRSLEELQKQYAGTGKNGGMGGPGGRGPGGPMGGPRRGPGGPGVRAKGKPKNMRATVLRLLSYVAKYRFQLILVFFFMIVNTLTSLYGGYQLRPILNAIVDVTVPASERLAGLAATLFILGCVYTVGIVTNYVQARLMLKISQDATEALRRDLFNSVQELPVRFFDSTPTGETMSRFTNDIDSIDMMINNSLTGLVSGVINLVGTFIMMLSTNIWLTLITIVFIPIFAKGGGAIAKLSTRYYSGQQAALGAVNGYIEESVSGQKVVKVFNHENICVDEFTALNDDMRDKQFRAQFWGGVMGPIMGNTSQISYALTAGIGGLLCLAGRFDVGGLALFVGYSRQFSMPINMISQQMATIFSALACAERVFNVMDQTPEEPDRERALQLPTDTAGRVELSHVTFGYNPDKVILRDITLTAEPGQKIAFVGSTGAGKTTVTNLLNRFYDIQEGEIRIDGVSIRDYTRDSLREGIAMVLQDTHLFTGTVMENIRYGRLDATDDEVIAAAKTASAHSFIMRLSDGYQTMLEGDGANLSQGQRQLLNIARAALSKAPILVLDEATSSVDTRTERHIEHGLARLMKNRTTFVIAHRLSTVRNSDAIMVLEQGSIIERGSHDELLSLRGRYYELYTGIKELD